MSSEQLRCQQCKKNFQSISSRNQHQRIVHKENLLNSKNQKRKCCPLCHPTTAFCSFELLSDHLWEKHELKCENETKDFKTLEEFYQWKENTEKQTNSFYLKTKTYKSTFATVLHYECHRSNSNGFKSKATIRIPKRSTIKINGVCPSRIKAEIFQKIAKITVTFVSTHVGHENELIYQPLKQTEQTWIVDQIRNGLSYEEILKQARLQNEYCGRLNLLTLKDIYYIAGKNKLNGIKNKSDLGAVDMKVAEWNSGGRNNVFLFKKTGEEHQELDKKDFALGFINEEMEYMLKTYGQRVICMDGTHGTNKYNFGLTTISILDDLNKSYPTAILISNRKDTHMQEIFLRELKNIIGVIIPKYFITDDTPIYFNAWNNVMSPLQQRLLCTWHVKSNWSIHISKKISHPETKRKVNEDLNAMLNETEISEFLRLKNNLVEFLESKNEITFLNYLNKYYLQSDELIMRWAECYRKNVGNNVNMHLESLHKTLKYKYFSMKTMRKLESCLDALERLVNDKSWQRRSLLKPHAGHQDSLINKTHMQAMAMKFDSVAAESDLKFLVHCPNKINYQEVIKSSDKCNCETLRCVTCDTCVHNFICTCHESAIKNQFCKHMHLVAMYTKSKDTINNKTVSDDDVDLQIDVISETEIQFNEEETLEISTQSQNKPDEEEYIREIQNKINSILSLCETDEDHNYFIKKLTEIDEHFKKKNLVDETTTNKRKAETNEISPSKKCKYD